LAGKDVTQSRLGQEVVGPRVDPAGVIEREAAGGNDDMEMRMEPEFLIPGVQHAEETNLCTEVSRIASHFEKCFRADTKQEIVEDLFVVQQQRSQVAGECEDHVQVARGEQVSLRGGDPAFPSCDLPLWTVTITEAVCRVRGMFASERSLI